MTRKISLHFRCMHICLHMLHQKGLSQQQTMKGHMRNCSLGKMNCLGLKTFFSPPICSQHISRELITFFLWSAPTNDHYWTSYIAYFAWCLFPLRGFVRKSISLRPTCHQSIGSPDKLLSWKTWKDPSLPRTLFFSIQTHAFLNGAPHAQRFPFFFGKGDLIFAVVNYWTIYEYRFRKCMHHCTSGKVHTVHSSFNQ